MTGHPTEPTPDPIARWLGPRGPRDLSARILEASLTAGGDEDERPAKVSVATRLVAIAEQHYSMARTSEGEPYAVPTSGPPIVRMLRGGQHSLRSELARRFHDDSAGGAVATQSALADALAVLEGKAATVEPVALHLRVADHDGASVLDLGDESGRCVVVDRDGWRLVDRPPAGVLFRRTALTGALPVPVRGGDLGPLWSALNVGERYRPLVAGVLVAALLPGIPHPPVLLTGEQGTGKSTATARLGSIIDPSPAQLRKSPRDVEAWTTAAAGSWVVALDNLSAVSDWLSDALCRAATGDGDVRRRLYTDGELHVIAFRRVVLLNGIDVGALRGDLADRLVHLALDRIPDDRRRTDREMAEQWRRAHPGVLGALLDLAVRVLAVLPSIELDTLPRMADFARVLAAVDAVLGTDALGAYLGLRDELAADAGTSDPVLVALTERVTGEWTGTSAELLELVEGTMLDTLRDGNRPRGWPSNARALTAVLTRQAPTLRTIGWCVERHERGAGGREGRSVRWTLRPPDGSGAR